MYGLIDAANEAGIENSFVHAFTDGRDVDPKSGLGYIEKLEDYLLDKPTKLASITGRYYAMDRDKRWERVKLAYDALVNNVGDLSVRHKMPLKPTMTMESPMNL